MIKKLIFILCFCFLANCGFEPIHNAKKNMGIYIESINFQNGDRDLNNLIQNNLNRYQRTQLGNKYEIEGNTKYEKKNNLKGRNWISK